MVDDHVRQGAVSTMVCNGHKQAADGGNVWHCASGMLSDDHFHAGDSTGHG